MTNLEVVDAGKLLGLKKQEEEEQEIHPILMQDGALSANVQDSGVFRAAVDIYNSSRAQGEATSIEVACNLALDFQERFRSTVTARYAAKQENVENA